MAEPVKSEYVPHIIYSPKFVLISNKRCILNMHIHTYQHKFENMLYVSFLVITPSL